MIELKTGRMGMILMILMTFALQYVGFTPHSAPGGGGTHVYWWYGDVPLWRPPFSDPDFRSVDTTHNRNSAQKTPITKHLRSHAYQNSRVVARDCSPRSPGLKTPENSSLHCSLANLRCTCMHVMEVIMYNVLHYPISLLVLNVQFPIPHFFTLLVSFVVPYRPCFSLCPIVP